MSVEGLTSALGNARTNAYNPNSQSNFQTYASEIQAAIGAKQLDGNGLKGSVRVAFSLSAGGSLSCADIAQSSGHSTLDSRALDVLSGVQFPSAPNGVASTRTFYCQFIFV
jgi:TonB family protein